jgi:hypothetical protein
MTDNVGFLVVAGLAAFRIWVLLASDGITAPLRAQLSARVAGWLTCPWCAGFWIAVAVFLILREWGDVEWVEIVTMIFALSGLVGLLGVWTGKDVDG